MTRDRQPDLADAPGAMDTFDPSRYGDGAASFLDQIYPTVEPQLVATLAALAHGGPALELGVGTGRVAIPLRRAGVVVHGIEASAAMIAAFRARAGSEDIPVILGDFAVTPLATSYRLVYSLVDTLLLLPSLDLQRRCLHLVARHLQPGGTFLVEAFSTASSFPLPDTVEVPIHTPGGTRSYRATTLRTPLEVVDGMAHEARLTLVARWSNWSRAPYCPGQPRHISLYRRPEDEAG